MRYSTRRQLLSMTGVSIAAALAGCSSNGDEEPTPAATTEATETDAAGTDTATQTATETATEDDVTQVIVGPNGELRFSPADLTVAAGETVEWVWSSGGHNVVVDSKPEGSTWGGTEGGASTTYQSGHAHQHTFETTGDYAYYCNPHRGAGMTATLTVE